MKSPFPGMDPYLERHWRDVHGTLIVHSRAMLSRQLGGGLRARIDERPVIEHLWDEAKSIAPDNVIVEHGFARGPVIALGGVAVAEPLIIPTPEARAKERFIEIIDPATGGKVVTAIEFLSPTNKMAGDGREQYLRKQRDVMASNVNLVEIDLTRSGRRQLALPQAEMPSAANTPYLVCTYRSSDSRCFEIYPISLRDRLPVIRIPLRPTDVDIAIDLQLLVDLAYEEGRHDDIDYSKEAVPPLTGDDAMWAEGLLTRAGRR